MYCIEVQNVTKKYGKKVALNSVSFNIACGERYALLGPNGAGKSTTLKILAGLLKPDEGKVSIFGYPPDSIEARKLMGYLPEDASPYRVLSVRENLEYIGALRGVEDLNERVNFLIDIFELKEFEKARVSSISRGNMQKLALALALIHNPKIILFDEPLNYLDIPMQEKVINILNSLNLTALISTHIMSVALRLTKKVIMISRGRILWQGSIEELRKMGEEHEQIESIVARIMSNDTKTN
jgi:ABC-type multidrug transport system, ATPase component